jgi:hypothetical protein
MRIPTYDQSVGAAAPQISAPRVADPVDLSQAINFVEGRYEQGLKQQEQDYKLYVANETARTQISIDEKYAEMVEALDNGDYEAETKFQKFYDKAVNQSLGRLNGDPAIQESIKLDYQRSGVEYGLRLKEAKRGKLKADAAVGFNQQLNNIKVKVSNAQSLTERQSLLAQAADVYAQAESTNVFAKGAGILGMQELVDESIRDYAYNKPDQFLAEHKQNPKSFEGVTDLAKVVDGAKGVIKQRKAEADLLVAEQQKLKERQVRSDILNDQEMSFEEKKYLIAKMEIDNEISSGFASDARGLVTAQEGLIDDKTKALKNYDDAVALGLPAEQGDTDIAFSQFYKEGKASSTEDIVSFVAQSGRVPTQLQRAANISLTSNMDDASSDDIAEAYSMAVMVTQAQDNLFIKNAEGSFNKDIEAAASSIVSKVDAGVPIEVAVKQTTKMYSDPEYLTRFKKAKTEALEGIQKKPSVLGVSDEFDPNAAIDYADAYARRRAIFDSESEAKKYAESEVSKMYDSYNGFTVKQPPHLMFPQYEKKSWEKIGKNLEKDYRAQGLVSDDENVVLASSSVTMAAIQELKNTGQPIDPSKVPFAVLAASDGGSFRPVYVEVEINGAKTMRPKFVYGNPSVNLKKVYKLKGIGGGF